MRQINSQGKGFTLIISRALYKSQHISCPTAIRYVSVLNICHFLLIGENGDAQSPPPLLHKKAANYILTAKLKMGKIYRLLTFGRETFYRQPTSELHKSYLTQNVDFLREGCRYFWSYILITGDA
jgi:hypothetical protein